MESIDQLNQQFAHHVQEWGKYAYLASIEQGKAEHIQWQIDAKLSKERAIKELASR